MTKRVFYIKKRGKSQIKQPYIDKLFIKKSKFDTGVASWSSKNDSLIMVFPQNTDTPWLMFKQWEISNFGAKLMLLSLRSS